MRVIEIREDSLRSLAENVEKIYDFYENNTNIYMTASPVEGAKKSGEPLIWWQKYYFNYGSYYCFCGTLFV